MEGGTHTAHNTQYTCSCPTLALRFISLAIYVKLIKKMLESTAES